jgi:WD40 repeat protein
MGDASLVDANLGESVLAEAFDFLSSVALSGDGALVAAGTSTGQVWLWRSADWTPLWVVQAHTGSVRRVALSAEGRLVASGGGGGSARLWETATGRPLVTLSGTAMVSVSVALSNDGLLVAAGKISFRPELALTHLRLAELLADDAKDAERRKPGGRSR